MNSPQLKFGTDGWRAIIGEQYTFDNVGRVAVATARWLHQQTASTPTVVVGHDTRFEGAAFALHASRVLRACGVEVILGAGFTPTPAISWATKVWDAHAGVVLTASHNPPAWNGFKVKADFGGPALPSQIAEIEALIPPLAEVPEAKDVDIPLRDIKAAYVEMLKEVIDVEAIRKAGLHVVHDAMYGAGQGVLAAALGADLVSPMHSEFNPGFGGVPPEPIERNLAGLLAAVPAQGAAAGIANDGDADRIGMVDERGRFVDSHRLLALLLQYLHEEKGLRGEVVKTFSTTDLLDRMAATFSLPLFTAPIGFKYVCDRMLSEDVLIGGEESGGLAVKGHLPERDGIYIGLLILEMLAHRGAKLSELVDDLHRRFGPLAYYRIDAHTSVDCMARAMDRLRDGNGLATLAGERVIRVETLDGYKHRLEDGWVLVRPSGTEPVLRIYSEASTAQRATMLVEQTALELGVK